MTFSNADHGEFCRCEMCCAEQVETKPTFFRTVQRRALDLAQHGRRWTREAALPRARQWYSVGRRWIEAHRHDRRLIAAVCGGMILMMVAAVVIRGFGDDRPYLLLPETELERQSRIVEVDKPVLVQVTAGPADGILDLSPRKRRRLAQKVAKDIAPVGRQYPDRVVAVQVTDLPLSFWSLPTAARNELTSSLGQDAPNRYETSLAKFLDTLIHVMHKQQPDTVVSIVGLPIEPEEAGLSLAVARQSNERYGVVIDRLGPFVPGRKLIVFGSMLDEKKLARMGMRESLRLRDGRPIVFQTNVVWQALIDADGPSYETSLARSADRVGRELEASLLDD